MIAALKALRKNLNTVLDHPVLEDKFGKERLEKTLKEYGVEKLELHQIGMALTEFQIDTRKGEERLLKVIFGEEEPEINDDENDDEPEEIEVSKEDFEKCIAKHYWELTERHHHFKDRFKKLASKNTLFEKIYNATLEDMEKELARIEKLAVITNLELGKYKENK